MKPAHDQTPTTPGVAPGGSVSSSTVPLPDSFRFQPELNAVLFSATQEQQRTLTTPLGVKLLSPKFLSVTSAMKKGLLALCVAVLAASAEARTPPVTQPQPTEAAVQVETYPNQGKPYEILNMAPGETRLFHAHEDVFAFKGGTISCDPNLPGTLVLKSGPTSAQSGLRFQITPKAGGVYEVTRMVTPPAPPVSTSDYAFAGILAVLLTGVPFGAILLGGAREHY